MKIAGFTTTSGSIDVELALGAARPSLKRVLRKLLLVFSSKISLSPALILVFRLVHCLFPNINKIQLHYHSLT